MMKTTKAEVPDARIIAIMPSRVNVEQGVDWQMPVGTRTREGGRGRKRKDHHPRSALDNIWSQSYCLPPQGRALIGRRCPANFPVMSLVAARRCMIQQSTVSPHLMPDGHHSRREPESARRTSPIIKIGVVEQEAASERTTTGG